MTLAPKKSVSRYMPNQAVALSKIVSSKGEKRTLQTGFLCSLLMLLLGCGGGSTSSGSSDTPQTPTPTITTVAAQNNAQVVTLKDSSSSAVVYYTLDGSTPTESSARYFAPILITTNVTLKAMAKVSGSSASQTASQTFSPNLSSGTLVWSDEFTNSSGAATAPDSTVWTYDTGGGGWGNSELETYCAWNSSTSPCSTSTPNVYVGTDGYLHIVARQPSSGVYTSARLKTQGLFSLNYGRVEARILMPEGQGLWPAFWMLGSNISTINWPACGEQDIMEHVSAPSPDWVAASLHGTNANLTQKYPDSTGSSFSAAQWHTYGMIWSKNSIQFYIDSPANIYATYSASSLTGQSGAVWPFDSGSGAFLILNLAVGGSWPGSPDSSTVFPSEMLVDYVRVYTN